ncbi:MAG: GMC family oxidoreductase N-terminal domain-containing protein, partial [Vulcanimicrobiaceae bacterium]
FTADRTFEADVAIVGSGAGGGTAAEILSDAGLRVILVEEGPLWTSSDFRMLERESYPNLYQESAGRKTKDKGINILQGRSVGGSTTVNWTTSLRTPPQTPAYWRERFGLPDFEERELAPWFARVEERLNVKPWGEPPNANNDVLRIGAAKLGIPTQTIPRNVKGCWNLGYCGLGCPTNAKQSMLVTTIPAALSKGAVLLSRTRAWKLEPAGSHRIASLSCQAMQPDGVRPGPHTISIRARHFVVASGAIGSPALLLRSGVPDPYGRAGKRTFLHPTLVSAALMPYEVHPYAGAPQSVFSEHFLYVDPIDGPAGYKLEVPPLHPILTSTNVPGFGAGHQAFMSNMRSASAIIALLRDGFNDQSQGGTVELNSDGTPVLDYPISGFLWEGARRALQTMAEIQFAAGAKSVYPLHEDAAPYPSLDRARAAIAGLPMEVLRTRVASAHVMGGCAMGADPKTAVVDANGSHHQVENLSVFDGSVFPTSLGANPQLSIYAVVARNATRLAARLDSRRAATTAATRHAG